MEKENTVEIAEPVAVAEKPPAPTREELREKGWSAAEMDAAEKHAMVAKPAPAAEVKPEPAKPAPEPEATKPAPQNGALPDFAMTPAQEKVFLETFGPGTQPRAMYFRMKNERQTRQRAEDRTRQLEAEVAALKAHPAAPVDEDAEDQPLTIKALRQLQKQQADEYQKSEQARQERASVVVKAQTDQEEYAKSIYPDFDDAVTRAKDVMQNLDAVIQEPWKRAKAIKLMQDLQVAAANADKLGIDDYNAALIAYEIGALHPEHGKAPNSTGTSKDSPKNGAFTPDQMKKVVENTQRRASSASVPAGGGKRTVSVEDVDLAALNKMGYAERDSFRKAHPERYAKLLRG